MYLLAQRDQSRLDLRLEGQWRSQQLQQVDAALGAVDLAGVKTLHCEASAAEFDLSGAWLLHNFLGRVRGAGISAEFDGAPPASLALVERTLSGFPDQALQEMPLHSLLDAGAAVEGLGRRVVNSWWRLQSALDFAGRLTVAAGSASVHLRRLHPISVARHVYETGVTAIPIAALIAFLISVILAFMGAQQLLKFGADIFVVDLVTIGQLRELGVLLTAIIVAGRSGSAFAAELGAMQLNEEVDALRAMGIEPIEVLVLPRVLGLVIALPLLTVIADIIGLVGGGLLCHALLHMPLAQYLNRVQESIAPTTFWVGLLKAPVFAVLIAVSGCWCGLRVRGSSRDLGTKTTAAVVLAIFMVLLADALFAVLFMELDI
jgi:phospholipid/cholesterol/gamma-HCH transport system permease protein